MSDVQTHFVAVCPHCAAQLKIRQVYLGHTVRCKQCNHAFRADEPAAVSDSSDSQVGGAGPAIQSWPQKDKIVVTCPSCQDSLRVPRGYIGQAVRCKRCDYKFVVTAPGEAQPQPEAAATAAETGHAATAAEHQQLLAENQRLQAAWDQLQA
ncbi:MAG TPA: MJ0042-type zinc finger domain-containing protein, partial [Isosphaeraceae bacterium]|nr:MJ0042-type zinc finger domain-containing protein [Isosphaeraceae bacterium]